MSKFTGRGVKSRIKYNDKHRWKAGRPRWDAFPFRDPYKRATIHGAQGVSINRRSGANDFFHHISLPTFISKLSSKVLILLDRKPTRSSPFGCRDQMSDNGKDRERRNETARETKRNRLLSSITYLGQGVLRHHIAGISHDSQWKLAPTTITQRPRFIRFLLGLLGCIFLRSMLHVPPPSFPSLSSSLLLFLLLLLLPLPILPSLATRRPRRRRRRKRKNLVSFLSFFHR